MAAGERIGWEGLEWEREEWEEGCVGEATEEEEEEEGGAFVVVGDGTTPTIFPSPPPTNLGTMVDEFQLGMGW